MLIFKQMENFENSRTNNAKLKINRYFRNKIEVK